MLRPVCESPCSPVIAKYLYLTGSRFFQTHRPDSDFDYFAEDGEEIRTLLNADGFTQTQAQMSPFANTVAVFEKGKIHIQLVQDLKLKVRVQETIRFCGFGELCKDKTFARRLWGFAYVLLKGSKL